MAAMSTTVSGAAGELPGSVEMVRQTDAHLRRFLPLGAGDDIEARPILLFLHALWAFANIAASASASHATVTPGTHVHDFNICLSVSRSNILNLILHSPGQLELGRDKGHGIVDCL